MLTAQFIPDTNKCATWGQAISTIGLLTQVAHPKEFVIASLKVENTINEKWYPMAQDFVARLLMTVDAADLTEDQVRSFKDNPNLLEFIEDREALGLHILWRILLVAVAFVAGSKIIAVKFYNEFYQFLVNVASDLVFEMGAALIGSVATVIFSEYQNKRQLNENKEFRSNLLQRIKQLPDETLANES